MQNTQDNPLAIFEQFPASKYNQILPAEINTRISSLHKVSVNVVHINPNEMAGDVYKPPKSSGLALTSNALRRIAAAAGIQILSIEQVVPSTCFKCVEIARRSKIAPQCRKCEGNGDVAFKARISITDLSGTKREIEKTREFLCDDEKAGVSDGQYRTAHRFRASYAESKALNRAIREALGIKGTYTDEDLQKPFAIPMISPDFDNPELKEALLSRYSRGDADIFGGGSGTHALESRETPLALEEATPCEPDSYDQQDAYDVPMQKPDEIDPRLSGPECHECGAILEDFTSKKGREWTARGWASWTNEKYGKPLCPRCVFAQAKAGAA